VAITVRIKNSLGECASRDEIASLFAADTDYVPFKRANNVTRDGVITVHVPFFPVILETKLIIPGYGHMWVTADNLGAGYHDGAELDFVREAAVCRIAEVETLLSGASFTPSVRCLSFLQEARTLFALAEKTSGAKGDEYAMTALAAALWAGEAAAVERAKTRIVRLERHREFLFGCGGFTYPFNDEPAWKEIFDSTFNYMTLPFYLAWVEKEWGKPDYTMIDAALAACESAGIKTKGHPLWWAHPAGMPPWTKELGWKDGGIKKEINRVISERLGRYRGRIQIYDIINEAHDWCNAWLLSQDELVEMTGVCAEAVRSADPSCMTIVNTCFMFGENAADGKVQAGINNERNMVPYSYIKKLSHAGVDYDVIGMQLYCPSRDMLALDKLYDRFAVFGKPFHITEFGVPSHDTDVPPDTSWESTYCLRYMYKGLWHEMGWNERLQADWIEDFYTISYARPEVEAMTWWSFSDRTSYIPGAGLMKADASPKEALFRLRELERSWGFVFPGSR
jgi:GH35 family endo-1,4-beta-xylanase